MRKRESKQAGQRVRACCLSMVVARVVLHKYTVTHSPSLLSRCLSNQPPGAPFIAHLGTPIVTVAGVARACCC